MIRIGMKPLGLNRKAVFLKFWHIGRKFTLNLMTFFYFAQILVNLIQIILTTTFLKGVQPKVALQPI